MKHVSVDNICVDTGVVPIRDAFGLAVHKAHDNSMQHQPKEKHEVAMITSCNS